MGLLYNVFNSFLQVLALENTGYFMIGFLCACFPLLLVMYYVLSMENNRIQSNSIFPFVTGQVIDNLPAISKGEHIHVEFRHERISKNDMISRSQAFHHFMNQRRTVRFFSTDAVPIEVIQNCILTAGTAPSGAHCQPWTFVIVKDEVIKTQLREIIENEERVNYDHRMSSDWIQDLDPLFGNLHVENEVVKPYIEEAPYIIIVLKQQYGLNKVNGGRIAHYYPMESVCIATGILLTALHNANLVSLVSTPMGAENTVRSLCNRPDNERVLFFIPVGYPADNATVPYRNDEYLRKSIRDILYIV